MTNEKPERTKEDENLVVSAISKLENIFRSSSKTREAILKELFFDSDKQTITNIPSRLKNQRSPRLAIKVIEAIKKYEDKNKNEAEPVTLSDLNNFFIQENVFKGIDYESAKNLKGTYLLFRYSSVNYDIDEEEDDEIIISYMNVNYKDSTLLYESTRIVYGQRIKTKGLIIKNQDSSYFCLGISSNMNDASMNFVETLKIDKHNAVNSTKANMGIFSGIIPETPNSPFVSRVVIVKIDHPESIKKIEEDVKRKSGYEIIKSYNLRNEEQNKFIDDLLSKEGEVTKEDGRTKIKCTINDIKNNLDISNEKHQFLILKHYKRFNADKKL